MAQGTCRGVYSKWIHVILKILQQGEKVGADEKRIFEEYEARGLSMPWSRHALVHSLFSRFTLVHHSSIGPSKLGATI